MKNLKLIFLGCLFVFASGKLFAQQPETKVTLGIKPDYWYTMDGTGVRLKGVVKGEIAEKLGMQEGDIILAFDDKPIKDIFAYKDLLSKYSSGDKVKVKVRRDKKIIYFNATFK